MDPNKEILPVKYSRVAIDGCSVLVWYDCDRWHACVPGYGASNYGPKIKSVCDMTVRDAHGMWVHNGKPEPSSEFIPHGWCEVPLAELYEA